MQQCVYVSPEVPTFSKKDVQGVKKEGRGQCHSEVTVVGADGAALVVGDDRVGAITGVLADDLVAHHGAAVAHADLAWLWFPHIPVRKHLAVQGAAFALACRGRQTSWDEKKKNNCGTLGGSI